VYRCECGRYTYDQEAGCTIGHQSLSHRFKTQVRSSAISKDLGACGMGSIAVLVVAGATQAATHLGATRQRLIGGGVAIVGTPSSGTARGGIAAVGTARGGAAGVSLVVGSFSPISSVACSLSNLAKCTGASRTCNGVLRLLYPCCSTQCAHLAVPRNHFRRTAHSFWGSKCASLGR